MKGTSLILLPILSAVYEVLVRTLSHQIPPAQLILLQTLLAASGALIILPRPKLDEMLSASDWFFCFAISAIGVLGANSLWNLALRSGHLGTVSTIAVFPFEGLWGLLLFGEMLSARVLSGWFVSFIGIAILYGANARSGLSNGVPELCALGADLLFTLGTALRRYVRTEVSDGSIVRAILFFQIPLSAARSAVAGELPQLPHSGTDSVLLLAVGVVIVLMNLNMAKAIRTYPLAVVGTAFLAKPAISFVTGASLFGDAITIYQGLGALIAISGVFLAARADPGYENTKTTKDSDPTSQDSAVQQACCFEEIVDDRRSADPANRSIVAMPRTRAVISGNETAEII